MPINPVFILLMKAHHEKKNFLRKNFQKAFLKTFQKDFLI